MKNNPLEKKVILLLHLTISILFSEMISDLVNALWKN